MNAYDEIMALIAGSPVGISTLLGMLIAPYIKWSYFKKDKLYTVCRAWNKIFIDRFLNMYWNRCIIIYHHVVRQASYYQTEDGRKMIPSWIRRGDVLAAQSYGAPKRGKKGRIHIWNGTIFVGTRGKMRAEVLSGFKLTEFSSVRYFTCCEIETYSFPEIDLGIAKIGEIIEATSDPHEYISVHVCRIEHTGSREIYVVAHRKSFITMDLISSFRRTFRPLPLKYSAIRFDPFPAMNVDNTLVSDIIQMHANSYPAFNWGVECTIDDKR